MRWEFGLEEAASELGVCRRKPEVDLEECVNERSCRAVHRYQTLGHGAGDPGFDVSSTDTADVRDVADDIARRVCRRSANDAVTNGETNRLEIDRAHMEDCFDVTRSKDHDRVAALDVDSCVWHDHFEDPPAGGSTHLKFDDVSIDLIEMGFDTVCDCQFENCIARG